MALTATIHKISLGVADIDRGHYGDYPLTVARHPSETEERMMVRVLAYALFAREGLEFGRGLSSDDEPDLWARDLTGRITLWIDVGLPDPRRVRKACGRADQVCLLVFGSARADIWWRDHAATLANQDNLQILRIAAAPSSELAALCERTLRLDVSIQDATALCSAATDSAAVPIETLKAAAR